jgi:hypothetical protein
MRIIKSKIISFIAFSILLTGCCDCFDPEPLIGVKYNGYTKEELKSFYLIRMNSNDTLYKIVDTLNNSSSIWVSSLSRYKIKSDNIPVDELIFVKNIDTKRTNWICSCVKSIDINVEYNGKLYYNEPIIINK